MFERIAVELDAWRKRRESLALHAKTLAAYRSGEYPENPTIGIGLAFQQGLLKARVLYQHAWCRDALQEGPIFLEAWKKSSMEATSLKYVQRFMYQPKVALDNAMSGSQAAWTSGWPAESLDDARSSAMRVVAWIHEQHPHWIEANLDVVLFSSNMPIFDTLLYHDLSTSSWASTQWPDRLINKEFAWSDWLAKSAAWMYPIVQNAYKAPNDEWFRISKHFEAWSPLLDMEPEEQLRKAIALMRLPEKEIHLGEYSDRGILWKALTSNVPTDIANFIGAALGCAWPNMHSDCLAIQRHFYSDLENNENTAACGMGRPFDNEVVIEKAWSNGALATLSLYDNPEQWVQAMVDVWSMQKYNLNNQTMEIELPPSLFS